LPYNLTPGQPPLARCGEPGEKKPQTYHLAQDLGVLVDTVINSEVYRSLYTFDEAQDGRYTLLLQSGKDKFSKQIELSTVTLRKMKLD